MPNEKTITLKPYDQEVADDVFYGLFYSGEDDEERGLKEIPAASYQLVVSALEAILWDVNSKKEWETIKKAVGICEDLRDKQQRREYARRRLGEK